jgi:hypothetical protein
MLYPVPSVFRRGRYSASYCGNTLHNNLSGQRLPQLHLYITTRTISIFVNIVVYGLLIIMIGRFQLSYGTDPRGSRGNKPPASAVDVLYLLTRRLLNYCIVQTISRIGVTWYQLQFGFGSYDYATSDPTQLETALKYVQAFLTPSAGIGASSLILSNHPTPHFYSCYYAPGAILLVN